MNPKSKDKPKAFQVSQILWLKVGKFFISRTQAGLEPLCNLVWSPLQSPKLQLYPTMPSLTSLSYISNVFFFFFFRWLFLWKGCNGKLDQQKETYKSHDKSCSSFSSTYTKQDSENGHQPLARDTSKIK